MSTRLDELIDAINKSDKTISFIAQKSGVTRQTIYNLINRKKPKVGLETFHALCSTLGIDTNSLNNNFHPDNFTLAQFDRNVVKIKVFGEIPAGTPIDMVDDCEVIDEEEIPAEWLKGGHKFFGLRVKGDSMHPEFKNGDTLILQQQPNCETGSYCAVSINGTECTFKKVIKSPSGILLQPLNPNYDPVVFSNHEIMELPVSILGTVVEVRRSYKFGNTNKVGGGILEAFERGEIEGRQNTKDKLLKGKDEMA